LAFSFVGLLSLWHCHGLPLINPVSLFDIDLLTFSLKLSDHVILRDNETMFSTQQSIALILGFAIVIHTAVGYTGWCLRSQAQTPPKYSVFRMSMQKSNKQKSIYREFLEKFGLPEEETQQQGSVKNIKLREPKPMKDERTSLDDIKPGSKHSGQIVSIRRYVYE
jgi:hypothetical protein